METSSKETFRDVINGDKPVLVDFFAEWCGPCKMMTPILHQLRDRMQDKVRILKLDVDKNPAMANAFQVQGVPTLVLFSKGAVVWRQSGVVPVNVLENIIKQHTAV
ncbi:MAG TPA: thioredoxin [Chitinophagaceae bacterium]